MASFHCEVGSVNRVAIIGAGMSGLVAIKACLEEQLDPVCFEKSSAIGGLWAHQKNHYCHGASLYSSLVFNTCKEMTCFSDFPYPRSYPPYIRPQQHLDYLKSYAKNFGLEDFIRFNTAVIDVSQILLPSETANQKWRLRVKDVTKQLTQVKEEVFDAVMICTGNYTKAKAPEYPGQDKFLGRTIHSNCFRQGSDYEDEVVVVVGGGSSAGDVAVECSRFAKKVYLSTRRGTLPLPRFVDGGVPLDAYANTLLGKYLPRSIRDGVLLNVLLNLYKPKDLGIDVQQSRKAAVMINDEILNRILCGAVKPCMPIKEFKLNGVVFTDSTFREVDTVIYATGYQSTFPFIDDSILPDKPGKRSLYQNIFPTTIERPTLATVGMVSAVGAVGPIFELQARCAVAVFRGNTRLPAKQEMESWIAERKLKSIQACGSVKTKLDIVPTMLELSQLIGCQPRIWNYILKGDFKLASRLVFGPFYPYVTRLEGRHSWHGARQAILDGMDNMFSATRATSSSKTVKITREVNWRSVIVLILILIFMFYQLQFLPFK